MPGDGEASLVGDDDGEDDDFPEDEDDDMVDNLDDDVIPGGSDGRVIVYFKSLVQNYCNFPILYNKLQ